MAHSHAPLILKEVQKINLEIVKQHRSALIPTLQIYTIRNTLFRLNTAKKCLLQYFFYSKEAKYTNVEAQMFNISIKFYA